MQLLYMQPKQHQKLLCSTRVNRFNLKNDCALYKGKNNFTKRNSGTHVYKKTSFLCNLHVVTNKVKLTFIINHQQNMFNHILPEIDLVITSKNDNII